jgi:hypothetical protein
MTIHKNLETELNRPMLDVFVLDVAVGPPSVLAETSLPMSLRLFATGLSTVSEFAASPLSSQLAEGETDMVGLATGDDRETLRSAAMIGFFLADQSDHAARLVIDRVDFSSRVDPTQSWQATRRTGILLAARAGHGPIVFRRSHLRQIGSPPADLRAGLGLGDSRRPRRAQNRGFADCRRTQVASLPFTVSRSPTARPRDELAAGAFDRLLPGRVGSRIEFPFERRRNRPPRRTFSMA